MSSSTNRLIAYKATLNNLIDERDERTKARKRKKREMDSIIGLSVKDNEKHALRLNTEPRKLSDASIRLLDDGYCDNGFVIKKGTLEKYLNGENQYVRGWEYDGEEWQQTEVLNLTDDFVGTVNIGHQDFATFPFLVGEFRKEDLSIVDRENDRKGLDVNLRLDDESIFVQELKRKDYDIGVSSEFWYHINEADTDALSEMLGYWMPVIDEIFIFAYGLVGECGNVNSSGLELGVNMDEKKLTEEIVEETVEETIEETSEEPMEEVVENAENEEVENEGEEGGVEEVPEDDEDDTDEGFEETLAAINELRSQVANLSSEVESLKEANAELKKTNRKLSNKLKNENEKKAKFIENAKDISVKLGVNEEKPSEPKVEKSFALGDGIGD